MQVGELLHDRSQGLGGREGRAGDGAEDGLAQAQEATRTGLRGRVELLREALEGGAQVDAGGGPAQADDRVEAGGVEVVGEPGPGDGGDGVVGEVGEEGEQGGRGLAEQGDGGRGDRIAAARVGPPREVAGRGEGGEELSRCVAAGVAAPVGERLAEGRAEGGLEFAQEVTLEVVGVEGAEVELDAVEAIDPFGAAVLAEEAVEQRGELSLVHAAGPLDQVGGEVDVADTQLELDVVDPVAGHRSLSRPVPRGSRSRGGARRRRRRGWCG